MNRDPVARFLAVSVPATKPFPVGALKSAQQPADLRRTSRGAPAQRVRSDCVGGTVCPAVGGDWRPAS